MIYSRPTSFGCRASILDELTRSADAQVAVTTTTDDRLQPIGASDASCDDHVCTSSSSKG